MNNVVTKEDVKKKVDEYINSRREVIALYIDRLEEAQHYFKDPNINEKDKIALYKLMLTTGNLILSCDRVVLTILGKNTENLKDGNTLKEVMNNLTKSGNMLLKFKSSEEKISIDKEKHEYLKQVIEKLNKVKEKLKEIQIN